MFKLALEIQGQDRGKPSKTLSAEEAGLVMSKKQRISLTSQNYHLYRWQNAMLSLLKIVGLNEQIC